MCQIKGLHSFQTEQHWRYENDVAIFRRQRRRGHDPSQVDSLGHQHTVVQHQQLLQSCSWRNTFAQPALGQELLGQEG